MALDDLQRHLQECEPAYRRSLQALRHQTLADAVQIAGQYRETMMSLISTAVEAIRLEQLESAGTNQQRIATASAEQLLLPPAIGFRDLESIYRNMMAAERIPPAHLSRIVEVFANAREMLRIVISRERPQDATDGTPPELPTVE